MPKNSSCATPMFDDAGKEAGLRQTRTCWPWRDNLYAVRGSHQAMLSRSPRANLTFEEATRDLGYFELSPGVRYVFLIQHPGSPLAMLDSSPRTNLMFGEVAWDWCFFKLSPGVRYVFLIQHPGSPLAMPDSSARSNSMFGKATR